MRPLKCIALFILLGITFTLLLFMADAGQQAPKWVLVLTGSVFAGICTYYSYPYLPS
jgi:Na+/H+ antiporter NhaA